MQECRNASMQKCETINARIHQCKMQEQAALHSAFLHSALTTNTFFSVLLASVVYPVRLRSGQAGPQERRARRAEQEAHASDPPRIEPSAELQPRGGQHEQNPDDDG